MSEFLTAIFLGLVEGVTEFIPVSSTGHLVVFADWLGFSSPGHVFEVFIQLGAVLAVMVLYWQRIWSSFAGIAHDKIAQKFALNVIVATVPAVVAGLLAHEWIKELYTAPIVGISLIVGGVVILLVEKRFAKGTVAEIDDIPLRTALLIGLFQVLALVPGVSRSGATILGGLALGLDRKTSAEFSFLLAIPVIAGAVLFDTLQNWDAIAQGNNWSLLITGLVVAFVSAYAVLKLALGLIARWGFAPFAWYRIAAGILVLMFFV